MKEKKGNIIEKILFFFTYICLILTTIIYLLLTIYSFREPTEPVAKDFPMLANIALILIGITSFSFIILVLFFGGENKDDEVNSLIVVQKDEFVNLRRTVRNQRKELSKLNKLINMLKKK